MWITFSACAAGSGDWTSDSTPASEPLAEALERCAWWRGKPSPARSWAARCKKGGWTHVLSGAVIWPTSRSPIFLESTGTSEAIPASPFPPLVNGEGRTTADICGPSSPGSSTLFDQEECFSRMWPDTSHSVSVMCSQTWKDLVSDVRSASTARRKSALRIEGTESSSSVWPTATVGDSRNSARHSTTTGVMHTGTSLVDATRMWPTPATCDARTGYQHRPCGKKQINLETTVRGPQDQAKNRSSGNHFVLNPEWVETLMGFPTGWTDCGRWGTQSSPPKPPRHSSDSGGS